MNYKCKIISNINIIEFLTIHVAIELELILVKIILKIWISFKQKVERTFETLALFLSWIKEFTCGFKKYVIINVRKTPPPPPPLNEKFKIKMH
jgi:hypothetical protein